MQGNLPLDIPYHFQQVKLLETAITHTSAANENFDGREHNERLEFLGDAVLELCVSAELFKRFSHAREGQLTAMRSRLVNQQSLAEIARRVHLDSLVILGKGEESQGGREKDTILSDTLEALLGAIFLDGGMPAAQKVVAFFFAELWEGPDGREKPKDYKSRLQELTQLKFKGRPIYRLVSSEGPEHDKVFTVAVQLPEGTEVEATGSSIKRAEQTAAKLAEEMIVRAEKQPAEKKRKLRNKAQ